MSVSEIFGGLRSAHERPGERYDVAILGGGLAGLTLAIQLKQARPETSIFVGEKRTGPAPEAAFKVGESTVDLSAYYFAEVIGMKDHIEQVQNPKFGLRYFFSGVDNRDITARLELGPGNWYSSPSYQLDRGRFENELWSRAIKRGIEAFDGCRVLDFELGASEHTISYGREDSDGTLTARWLVDATGRASTLKRKLGLAKDVEHTINSSWFRLGHGLDYEQWGASDQKWMSRIVEPGIRHLSTTHLMGKGYWVWLIPLRSGPVSIGICADPRFHPYERIETLDAALDWLREHEPQLFEAVDPRRDQIEDFLRVKDFAFGCERVYSPERWCLTGEAAVFADPFYSPGSDFIAMGNTFITDLVTRDLDGEDVLQRTEIWNAQLFQLFGAFLRLYADLYPVFGNVRVCVPKLIWDHAVYWLLNALRFNSNRLTDLRFLQRSGPELQKGIQLTTTMQDLFKQWNELGDVEADAGFVNVALPPLMDHVDDLGHEFDDDTITRMFQEKVQFLEALAVLIFADAVRSLPGARIDEQTTINPYAISLDQGRWEEDGLLGGSGVTIADAREQLRGIQVSAMVREGPAA
ncbi:MAG: tryptophan 7-halogenase [Solirubrobacteraceae bacterium]